jgi:hypothetical protein
MLLIAAARESGCGTTRTCSRGRLMSAIGATADVICLERVFLVVARLKQLHLAGVARLLVARRR